MPQSSFGEDILLNQDARGVDTDPAAGWCWTGHPDTKNHLPALARVAGEMRLNSMVDFDCSKFDFSKVISKNNSYSCVSNLSSDAPAPSTTLSSPPSSPKPSSQPGKFVGILGGIFSGILALALLSCIVWRSQRRKKKRQSGLRKEPTYTSIL